MTYAFINKGATTRAYNAALTPALPSGYVAGNLLILQSQYYLGSISPPAVSGWTLLGSNQGIGVWGLIGAGTGADAPSVNWGTVNADADAWIMAYSGNPATLTGIVHASSTAGGPGNNVTFINYGNLTISVNGCLVLLCGTRNNTSATQPPQTFNSVGGGNGTFVIEQYANENTFSNDIAAVTNRQIQVAASSISGASQSMTASDATTQGYSSVSLALLPLAVAGIPVFWYS